MSFKEIYSSFRPLLTLYSVLLPLLFVGSGCSPLTGSALLGVSNTLTGTPPGTSSGGAIIRDQGPPKVTLALLNTDGITLGGKGLGSVSQMILLDSRNNTVVATFKNIKATSSGTYLTANPLAADSGGTLSLAAGLVYNLLIANAEAATISTIVIGTMSGPVSLSGGYANGIGIGNTPLPPNTTTGMEGILFTDAIGGPWIGATNSNGNIVLKAGGTPTSPGIVSTNSGLRVNQWLDINATACGFGTIGSNMYADTSTLGWTYANTHSTIGGTAIQFGACEAGAAANSMIFYRTTTPGTAGATAPVVESMRIDHTGNVGIGTTTPAAPLSIVSTNSGIRVNNWLDLNGTACGFGSIGSNMYPNKSTLGWTYANTHANIGGTAIQFGACAAGAAANSMIFYRTATPGTAGATAPVAESMRIDYTGNVGIGTTSPGSALQVGGLGAGGFATPTALQMDNSYRLGTGGNTSLKFYLYRNGTETYGFGLNSVGGVEYHAGLSTGSSAGNHAFYTDNVERMRISTAGNVGIGTSSPIAPLDISASTGSLALNAGSFVANNTGGGSVNTFTTGTYGGISLRATGVIVGGSLYVPSDRRLKDHIEGIQDETALNFIKNSKPVHFHWKNSGMGVYGFIAQDLLKMGLGEMVGSIAATEEEKALISKSADSDKGIPKGNKLIVNHEQLSAIITQAVKYVYSEVMKLSERISSQSAVVESLKSESLAKDKEIADLKARASHAEKENSSIKARLEKIEKMLQSK